MYRLVDEVLEMTELTRHQHSIVGEGDGAYGLSVEQVQCVVVGWWWWWEEAVIVVVGVARRFGHLRCGRGVVACRTEPCNSCYQAAC